MTICADADLWLRRFHEADSAAPRLICFPHAGGSAGAFFRLSAELAPDLGVLAVQYPGRQDRSREQPVEDLPTLADGVARLLVARADRTERDGSHRDSYALFGHSMGALVAFETARRMERAGRGPAVLFVSGHRAPGSDSDIPASLDDADLAAELVRLSGTDPAVLENEALMELILPAIRGDYLALNRYRFAPGPALSCPVAVLLGDADPEVSVTEAPQWAQHTESSCIVHVFEGDHFYLLPRVDELAALVRSTSLKACFAEA